MSRRPEIGNVQLYPDRPLRKSDRNGFVLKFYCPIRCKRIRRNGGTRDRREARRILRECRERLLNGEYAASGGAITESHAPVVLPTPEIAETNDCDLGRSWQECYDRYVEHRRNRVRQRSLGDAVSRLGIAERILEAYVIDWSLPGGLVMSNVATLDALEHVQDRLLAGDECRYDGKIAEHGKQHDGCRDGIHSLLPHSFVGVSNSTAGEA
jgi:hypothetical protein